MTNSQDDGFGHKFCEILLFATTGIQFEFNNFDIKFHTDLMLARKVGVCCSKDSRLQLLDKLQLGIILGTKHCIEHVQVVFT